MADDGKVTFKYVGDTSGIDSANKEAEGKLGKLGSAAGKIAAGIGAAAVAAGAAAYKLAKDVVASYAEYEQLIGGVETLFKTSADVVQEYAATAYKTAGLSANDYMTTVTGFSASLLQSLGGDTAAAAKIADMAIIDMADNANKMGSSMESIQNAYQGFAKQNYTMLDNLKLGYGGTKTEMERLLADAQKLSGIKYDISSLSDVMQAIHVIQTEIGITGTTALEATETISGSISTLGAAFENLKVGLGDANADVDALLDIVIESLENVIKNITPVIENIVESLPKLFDGIAGALTSLLPTLLNAATTLFTKVLGTLVSLLPELIPVAVDAILTIVDAVIENLPLIVDAAVQLVATLIQGLTDALPELIPAAIEAILTIVDGLIENLPLLLDAGLQLIMGLAQGLLDAIPQLLAALPGIIDALLQFFMDAVPQIIDVGIQLFVAIIEALPQIIAQIVEAIPQIIDGIVTALIGSIDKIIEAGVELFVALIENLPAIIVEIVKAIPKIIEAIVSGFAEFWGKMSEVGNDLIKGLWQGISDAGAWLREKISGFFGGVVDSIKNFFGIKSPSTLFAEIGSDLGEGIGVGFERAMKHVGDDMRDAIPTDFYVNAGLNIRGGRFRNNSTTLEDLALSSISRLYTADVSAKILSATPGTSNLTSTQSIGTINVYPDSKDYARILALLEDTDRARQVGRAGGSEWL